MNSPLKGPQFIAAGEDDSLRAFSSGCENVVACRDRSRGRAVAGEGRCVAAGRYGGELRAYRRATLGVGDEQVRRAAVLDAA